MATSEGDSCAKDCEAYVQKYSIHNLLKECIVQLCLHKPDSPNKFLKEYFAKKETELSHLGGSISVSAVHSDCICIKLTVKTATDTYNDS